MLLSYYYTQTRACVGDGLAPQAAVDLMSHRRERANEPLLLDITDMQVHRATVTKYVLAPSKPDRGM